MPHCCSSSGSSSCEGQQNSSLAVRLLTCQAPHGVGQPPGPAAGCQLLHAPHQLLAERIPHNRFDQLCNRQMWTAVCFDGVRGTARRHHPQQSSRAIHSSLNSRAAPTWLCLAMPPHHLSQPVHCGAGVDGIHQVPHIPHNGKYSGQAAPRGRQGANSRHAGCSMWAVLPHMRLPIHPAIGCLALAGR